MNRFLALAATLVLTACATHSDVRAHVFETRGVWVATVANIDWPSRRDLSAEEQQAELIRIFDRAAALGLNSVFLQVRPAADAIYPATHSPWSEYLTGTAGKAPTYDPLAFAVEEAHRRGLELHAWFNPFRAKHASSTSPLPASHIGVRRSDAVRQYGRQLWLDPGDVAARNEVIGAIVDVVQRYDVDGVHVDDYFYPYPERTETGDAIPFPDDPTWRSYRASGGRLDRGDWRRDNINRFVRSMYARVKAVRPEVKVGISPFGIWRPNHPAQIRGFDAYSEIYADSRLWLRRGWVDYLAPQLYWPIDQQAQSFTTLLDWWMGQDRRDRGIVVGMSVSRVASGRPNAITADEIARQIEAARKAGARGFILFSARALMEDRGGVNAAITDALARPMRPGGVTAR
ncbi:MAG: family 10 glycosylhydrolase [Thermoanaerobaculia bacterium]